MDGTDDEPGASRGVKRGPGRPPEWDVGEAELLALRREIATAVMAEMAEEWGGESRTVEWLLREFLARLRED